MQGKISFLRINKWWIQTQYVYMESLNYPCAIVYSFNISQIDSVFLRESEDIKKSVLFLFCGCGADLQVKVNPTSTYIRLMPCVDKTLLPDVN